MLLVHSCWCTKEDQGPDRVWTQNIIPGSSTFGSKFLNGLAYYKPRGVYAYQELCPGPNAENKEWAQRQAGGTWICPVVLDFSNDYKKLLQFPYCRYGLPSRTHPFHPTQLRVMIHELKPNTSLRIKIKKCKHACPCINELYNEVYIWGGVPFISLDSFHVCFPFTKFFWWVEEC